MRAGDLLSAIRNAPVSTLADKIGTRGVLIVAPHSDDESLGCGGLIAQAVASGNSVRIVIVTDGAGSHPNSPSYPATRLRDLREAEAQEAARRLGVEASAVHFLRLPDRHAPTTGGAARDAIAAIARLADEIDAGAIFTTWRGDPHCDHKAAWSLARDAARRATSRPRLHSYVVWGWELDADDATPESSAARAWRLDVSRERDIKANAIAAHVSQLTDLIDDDPGAFRLEQAVLERFRAPYEYFLEEDA